MCQRLKVRATLRNDGWTLTYKRTGRMWETRFGEGLVKNPSPDLYVALVQVVRIWRHTHFLETNIWPQWDDYFFCYGDDEV